MAQETFENPSKMRDFLKTLATMYNTSYNNMYHLQQLKKNIKNINIKLKMTKNHLK